MKNITIEISASTVAWYAAIVATVSVIINVLRYLDDRVKLAIEVKAGMRTFGYNPSYKKDTDYILVTVINKGKRPVTIGNVGFITKDKKESNAILSDSAFPANREIKEGQSTDYMLEQSTVDLSKIKYFVAYDKTGREFRGKLHQKK